MTWPDQKPIPSPEEYEPIEDDEILFRRVPLKLYDRKAEPPVHRDSFRPREYDKTALSLYRAKFQTAEDVGRTGTAKGYYVAHLRAGSIRRERMNVIPKPLESSPGHCEVEELNYANRRTDLSEERQLALAEKLCEKVEGPFYKE